MICCKAMTVLTSVKKLFHNQLQPTRLSVINTRATGQILVPYLHSLKRIWDLLMKFRNLTYMVTAPYLQGHACCHHQKYRGHSLKKPSFPKDVLLMPAVSLIRW